MRLDWHNVKGKLDDSLRGLTQSGVLVAYLEVGPETYELMQTVVLARSPDADVDYLRRRFDQGKIGLTYNDLPLRMREDVPEWRLWPARDLSVLASKRRIEADGGPDGFVA